MAYENHPTQGEFHRRQPLKNGWYALNKRRKKQGLPRIEFEDYCAGKRGVRSVMEYKDREPPKGHEGSIVFTIGGEESYVPRDMYHRAVELLEDGSSVAGVSAATSIPDAIVAYLRARLRMQT